MGGSKRDRGKVRGRKKTVKFQRRDWNLLEVEARATVEISCCQKRLHGTAYIDCSPVHHLGKERGWKQGRKERGIRGRKDGSLGKRATEASDTSF